MFDPQFACSEEDFRFCKGFGKSGDSYQHSKHAEDKGKEQPAVGGTGQPAVGGGGGKGKPAVGGKGQFVLE